MNDNKRTYSTIIIFIIIGLLVMGIGGIAGWVVVLHIKGQSLNLSDTLRGFGIGAPSGGENGSTYTNSIGDASGTRGGSGTPSGNSGTYGYDAQGKPLDASGAATPGESTTTVSLTDASSSIVKIVVPKTPRLWHVTKVPVAGYSFATSTPILYFTERASGYLFTADAIQGDVLRRTNTLMPKTYEAFLSRDGAAIYRSANETSDTIQTYSGIMGSSSSANLGSFIGVNLRNGIIAMDANPDAKVMFFLVSDTNGFTAYTEPWLSGKSGKEKQLFTTSIMSWRPIALSDGRLFVVQKAEDDAMGYAYEVTDGTFKSMMRGAPGLTFLPLSNASTFIYGTSANGSLALFAQTSTSTYAIPVKTTADKCVWAPFLAKATKGKPLSHQIVYCAVPSSVSGKKFLESWYIGAQHTSDSWWRIDVTSGEAAEIFSDASGGSSLDVIDATIDPSGNFLAFKNNVDASLWVLRINK
jgi:hypothetical protein